MKTAVIWNEVEELKYAVLDGDFRQYHRIYINMREPDDFDRKGQYEYLASQMMDAFGEDLECCDFQSFVQAIRDGAHCIECGWLP